MSKPNPDNPSFLTISELYGQWHVNLMEYNSRADDYQIARSAQLASKHNAEVYAREWAKRDGLEIR